MLKTLLCVEEEKGEAAVRIKVVRIVKSTTEAMTRIDAGKGKQNYK